MVSNRRVPSGASDGENTRHGHYSRKCHSIDNCPPLPPAASLWRPPFSKPKPRLRSQHLVRQVARRVDHRRCHNGGARGGENRYLRDSGPTRPLLHLLHPIGERRDVHLVPTHTQLLQGEFCGFAVPTRGLREHDDTALADNKAALRTLQKWPTPPSRFPPEDTARTQSVSGPQWRVIEVTNFAQPAGVIATLMTRLQPTKRCTIRSRTIPIVAQEQTQHRPSQLVTVRRSNYSHYPHSSTAHSHNSRASTWLHYRFSSTSQCKTAPRHCRRRQHAA